MKAVEIFDVCHGRYRGLRERLEDCSGAVRSLDLGRPSEAYHWRPVRARACEYVADFERIGRHGLRRPEWKGRLKLFNIYFLHNMEYRRAISAVGVAEGTFDYWYKEVKRALGAEFSRTNLYPPASYFLEVRSTHSDKDVLTRGLNGHSDGIRSRGGEKCPSAGEDRLL